MSIEFSVALLVFLLAVILTIYNHRQAAALKGVERLVEDFVAMQIRDRRKERAKELVSIDPFDWLSRQASSGLEKSVAVAEVVRTVPDVRAVELRLKNGERMIVSPFGKSEIMRFDRRLHSSGKKAKSAKDRLANFASKPLLGGSRWGWGVTTIERVMSQNDEFFDIEAQAVAGRLNVQWDLPSRLWFYVVR